MPILSSFVPGLQNVIHSHVRQLQMPKNAFKNGITLTLFFGHYTAQNKEIAFKFCVFAVCMYLDNKYFGVLDTLKILNFIVNDF